MASPPQTLTITRPKGGYAPSLAISTLRNAKLPDLLRQLAPGPFGDSAHPLAFLAAPSISVDLGLASAPGPDGLILQTLAG